MEEPEPWSPTPLSKLTNLLSCCHAMLSYATLRTALGDGRHKATSEAHHDWPAADAHPAVEGRGQQGEQQQREEEGGAADELEGVEAEAAGAAVDQLLQEQGHQGQQLGGAQRPEQRQSLHSMPPPPLPRASTSCFTGRNFLFASPHAAKGGGWRCDSRSQNCSAQHC